MSSNNKIKNKTLTVSSLAVLAMCLYMILQSVGYIAPALSTAQSICLYAFLGLSVASIIIRGKVEFNICWVWYFGFVILALISTLYAPNQVKSFSAIYNIVVVFGILFALSVILTSIERMEMLMNSLIFGAVILMIYLLATGEIDLTSDQVGRLGNELTGNANVFASIYMLAACSSSYFIIERKNVILKIIYIACFVLQMLALALSGGRKTFLVPIIVLFVTLLLKKDKRGKRHIILWACVGIVSVVVIFYALMNIPVLYDTVGHRFESFFEYSSGASSSSDASTIEREVMRERAIALWLEAPVFGHGFDAFSQLERWGVYSHCNYTELLCNHGLFGLVYYYSIWMYLLCRLAMCKQEHTFKSFMIGVLAGFLVCDYGSVSYALPMIQAFVIMAFVFVDLSKNKKENLE